MPTMMNFFISLAILEASVFLNVLALTIPHWADEEAYGKYQDAWKLLNQKEGSRYFLLQSTFRDKPHFWGHNFKCVTVRHTHHKQKEKAAVSIFQYVGVRNLTFTVSMGVKAVTQYGYKTPNALEYNLTGTRILIELVMFTNGGTCNLLSVPYQGTKLGCELWVIENSIDKVPACCLFMFRLLCPKNVVYNVYDNTCKNVLNRRGSEAEGARDRWKLPFAHTSLQICCHTCIVF